MDQALSPKDRFRANVLPWLYALGLAACTAWFLLRAYKGLPTAANPAKGDFEHFYHAAVAMSRGEDIYASHTGGYIYPPLLAALLTPLAGLEQRPAQLIWAGVNLALTIGVMWLAFSAWSARFRLPRDRLTVLGLSLVAVVLTFEQIRWEFEEGQTDTLVILGMVGALAAMDRRPWLAGVLTGFAMNIKYQAVILLPYYLVRRRWLEAAGTAFGAAFFALVPAVVCGWGRNLEYLRHATGGLGNLASGQGGVGAATNGIRWEKSVSIPSGFARMLGENASMAAVYGAAGAIALALLGVVWVMYRKRGVAMFVGRGGPGESSPLFRGVSGVEWCGLVVAVLAFSPQTMVRHSFILLPMNLLIAAILLVPRAGVVRWPLLAGVIVHQLGARLPPGNVESMKAALASWQHVSGSMWCLLVLIATLAWTGLDYARACAEKRPLLDPPPGHRPG